MKIEQVGMTKGGEAYLLLLDNVSILLDTGFSFSAEDMVKNIKSIVGDKPLDYCFISHSHYDHVSGLGYVVDEYPNVVVVGSAYAKKIIAKDSAKATMLSLNEDAYNLHHDDLKFKELDSKFDGFRIDLAMADGELLDLGEEVVQAIESVGHTKCCMSYYLQNSKLLICSETAGIPRGGDEVMPGYIVSYKTTIAHLEYLKILDIEKIFFAHSAILDMPPMRFIKNAISAATQMKEFVIGLHFSGISEELIYEEFKKKYYLAKVREKQPTEAFRLNATNTIKNLIKDFS